MKKLIVTIMKTSWTSFPVYKNDVHFDLDNVNLTINNKYNQKAFGNKTYD